MPKPRVVACAQSVGNKTVPTEVQRGPTATDHEPTKSPRLPTAHRSRTGYLLRLLLFLFVILFCLVWTAWLGILTIAPNDTMNRVMNTTIFDDGTFWLVVDPPPSVVAMGITGLSLITLGYLAIPFWIFTRQGQVRWASSRIASVSWRFSDHLEDFRYRFRRGARNRQVTTVLLKVFDLGFQFVYLSQYLHAGSPVQLIVIFTSIVTMSALSTAVLTCLPFQNMGLTHIVIDTTYDMLVAIAYPMLVLWYAATSFTFDRRLMDINIQSFRPGQFERIAAVLADPVEVTLIRQSFDSLRIRTVFDIFTRVGVNLSLCIRFHSLARFIVSSRSYQLSIPNEYPKNKYVAATFVLIAVVVASFAGESVRTSFRACMPYPQCVQISHRWISSNEPCPCIAVVDRDIYIKSYDEWLQPHNVQSVVEELSASGYLQTLQIVNRGLPALPETIRRCTNLRHLSLLYSETSSLPAWTSEFTQLEYMHIEGKATNTSLHELPSGIFSTMKSLAFLHLGQHLVEHLPSFDSLLELKALNLAVLPELRELPSFLHLANLNRLSLAYIPRIETVPDLAAVTHLEGFSTLDRASFCCNGFAGGNCDLKNPMCRKHPIFGTPPATCLPPSRWATPATLAYFKIFNSSICNGGVSVRPGLIVSDRGRVEQCGGVLFRKCAFPGFESSSICYNKRWMAISCEANLSAILMRRKQISQGLGLPCDPKHEAWLGCKG